MAHARCTDINEFKGRYPDRSKELPRIVLIIDEAAEVTRFKENKTLAQQARDYLTSITQLGRSSGVHCIIAAQHPSSQTVPTDVTTNTALKLAAPTGNPYTSQMLMGTWELYHLERNIKGRMMYEAGNDRAAIQTPHATRDQVDRAVKIAQGRASGLITLDDNHDIQIDEAGLLYWIVTQGGGTLAVSALYPRLRDCLVSERQLSEFLATIKERDLFTSGNRVYRVRRESGRYQLDLIEDQPQQETPPAEWAAAQQPLALPAPKVDIIGNFIRDVCFQGEQYKVKADTLHKRYVRWCIDQGHSALKRIAFGAELNERGYATVRKTEGIYRLGLGLPDESSNDE